MLFKKKKRESKFVIDEREASEDTQLTADLKRVILEKIEGKYDNDDSQKMTRKAKLLDPRNRGDHMKPPELSNLKTELVAEMAAAAEATRSSPTPSSDIHTSMTTLKRSTTLNKGANFQMSVLFQI